MGLRHPVAREAGTAGSLHLGAIGQDDLGVATLLLFGRRFPVAVDVRVVSIAAAGKLSADSVAATDGIAACFTTLPRLVFSI